MAHEKATPRNAVATDLEVSDLAVHFLDRRAAGFGVVTYVRVAAAGVGLAVLDVRHVNIDDAVEQCQGLEAVVAARVVDQRQSQPTLGRDEERLENLSHNVARGDEIDVVTSGRLQFEHHVGELFGVHFMASALLADLPVLAKDAAQIAPTEKNRAGAPAATERIFFAEVRAEPVHAGERAGAADHAVERYGAVDSAVAGAQIATVQAPARFSGPAFEFAGLQ